MLFKVKVYILFAKAFSLGLAWYVKVDGICWQAIEFSGSLALLYKQVMELPAEVLSAVTRRSRLNVWKEVVIVLFPREILDVENPL